MEAPRGNGSIKTPAEEQASCLALLFEQGTIFITGEHGLDGSLSIAGLHAVPALCFPDQRGGLTFSRTNENHGATSGKRTIDLAGNAQALHVGPQRHQMHVSGGQTGLQKRFWLVREKANVRPSCGLCCLDEPLLPGPFSDEAKA
jgi:hypothetical protein